MRAQPLRLCFASASASCVCRCLPQLLNLANAAASLASTGRHFPQRPGYSIVLEATFDKETLATELVPHAPEFDIVTELVRPAAAALRHRRLPAAASVYVACC